VSVVLAGCTRYSLAALSPFLGGLKTPCVRLRHWPQTHRFRHCRRTRL